MALTKVSGDILDSGISVAGVVTATKFDGPMTGSSGTFTGIVTATGLDLNGNADISGITTFTGVIDANATTQSTSSTTGAATFAGGVGIVKNLNVGGDVSIGGTLTYQDVTNIDSVGLITARAGVNISGGEFKVGTAVTIGTAGVITATSYYGDGSNLTNAGASLANGANDRIITATGANALNGEANLTFDGDKVVVTQSAANIGFEVHSTGSGKGAQTMYHNDHGTTYVGVAGNTSGETHFYNASNTATRFYTNSAERIVIAADGKIGIGINAPVAPLHIYAATNDNLLFGGNINASDGGAIRSMNSDASAWKAFELLSAEMRIGGTNSLRLSTGGTGGSVERLRIDSAGDVGVNITDPIAQLQVNSTRNAKTDRHSAANYHLALRNPADDNNEAIGLSFGITSNATKVGAAILHERDAGGSQGSLQFYTSSDGNSLSERLRIGSAGQFGIGGANWGSSGQVLTSGGASGAVSWSTVSGTTINNNAANRIITGEGGTTLNGEANLTYDGSQITSTVSSHDKGLKIVSTGDHGHFIEMKSNRGGADNILGIIGGTWDSNQVAQIRFMTGTDTTNKDEGCIGFVQRGPGGDWRRRFMVNETGKVHITGNNLTANSTQQGLLHVNQCSANEGYVTDIMDEFTAGTAFNSTSDGRATIRVEWAKGYSGGDTTQAICGLLIDGLSAGSGPSIGVCSWARAQVGNGGGINFFSRQESVYGRDYGVYGFRKRCPSSGGGEFLRGDIESNLLGINYGMKLELKDRTGTDNYAQGIWIDEQNNGATVHCMKFTRSGTEKGSIKITDSATSFNTSSDYRLKENNVPITDGVARVKQLKPYRFNWKGETAIVDGFFAHEAQTVVPESVTGTKDEVKNVYPETTTAENPTPDPIGTEPEYQQMDHSKLVPLLTAALQEAITEIETLKTKVAALESA